MTTDQMQNLALALIVLRNDTPATPGVQHAATLIESALPLAGTESRRDAFAAAWAQRNGEEAPAEKPAEVVRVAVEYDSIVALLERAARERQAVRIGGRKLSGERYYDRVVRPSRIEVRGHGWLQHDMLVCVDVGAAAPRTFRVDGIDRAVLDPREQKVAA